MEGLSGYGSGSDSDVDMPIPLAPSKAVVTAPQIQRKQEVSTKKQKTRKLNLSLLPQEIQTALSRGDSLQDSDDDEFIPSKPFSKSSTASISPPSIDLLKLLPKPTLGEPSMPLLKSKPFLDLKKDSEHPISSPSTVPSASIFSNSQRDPDSDSDEDSSEFPFNSDISSPFSSSCVNPSVSKPFLIPSFTRINPTPLSSSSFAPQPTVGPNNLPNPTLRTNDIDSSIERPPDFSGGGNLNKRRREKEIEQQLQRGNTSAIDQYSPHEMSAPNHSWNADEYSLQLKKESDIHSSYNIGGDGPGSIQQASKVQHRRHQINSLAMRAAETELKLLEAKGIRMKTKSETQAKYGW